MHDLRRRALQSGKTVSRKAQARNSGTASQANSQINSRSVSRHGSEDEDEDGNRSDSTVWSVNSIDVLLAEIAQDEASPDWVLNLRDRIEEIIDRKRSSVQGRESTLEQYVSLLMSHYAKDQIEKHTSEIYPALIKSIKVESSEKESSIALRAISLTLVTNPSEVAYDGLSQPLKHAFATSEFDRVKALAIQTLSLAAIYGGAADQEIEDIMDELLEIIESDGNSIDAEDSADVVVAAIAAWSFLATYVDDMEDKTEVAIDGIVDQLDSSATSVQVAAGETIALLYEKSYTDREPDDDPPTEDIDENGYALDTSVVKRYEVYRQKGQLEHSLHQITKASSKSIARKDRSTLHSNFRDILNAVKYPSRGPRYSNAIDQNTGKPYGSRMTVRIHKSGYMKIDKWWKLIRLQALRKALAGGFLIHYEDNEVVFETLPMMVLPRSEV